MRMSRRKNLRLKAPPRHEFLRFFPTRRIISVSTDLIKLQLFNSFSDKKARDLFVSQHISTNIAAQLYSMREDRRWTQKDLADKAGMAQSRISLLEDPDYGKYNIETLKRFASTFDVALIVRFVKFSELVHWFADVSPDDLAVYEFDRDSLILEPR